jgi:hypothetical protein
MTPNELYACPPIRTSSDIWGLRNFISLDLDDVEEGANTKIELRYYAQHQFDDRRGWNLFSVWYQDKPIMICQAAGRELDDYTNDFVTDPKGYEEMFHYIASLIDPYASPEAKYGPDVDREDLTTFYGASLDEFYAPAGVSPKHKVNDEVVVLVLEDHLRHWESKKIKTWVRISDVRPHNPKITYSGIQINRRWEGFGPSTHMVIAAGEGNVMAHFNESEICEDEDLPKGE